MSESQTSETSGSATTNGGETCAAKADDAPAVIGSSEMKSGNLATQLEEKIIRQVEYYFGDRNLPRDKFLQSAAAENEGGWVPIATLLTFNRLKALSSDANVIVRALRKSTSGVLEVNLEGDSVRRSPDNPPPDIFSAEQRKKMKEKTVYVKGFDVDTSLDDIQSFFDQYGKLEHVQMRRIPADRTFKGSVFAEFKEKEKALAFLELATVEFKGKELYKESREAYGVRKTEEKKKDKTSKEESQPDSKEEDSTPSTQVLTKDAVLFFKGVKTTTSRENIKEELNAHATVAFIDFSIGESQGHVRFEEEGSATKVLAALKEAAGEGGVITLCEAEVEVHVLQGEEEEQYWAKKAADNMMSKRGGGRRKRGRGRGGRGGGGGDRKRRRDDNPPPAVKLLKEDGGKSKEATEA